MIRPGLHILAGTLVFFLIVFYPITLCAPAGNTPTDLWLHLQPEIIEQALVNESEPPNSASPPPPAPFRPAKGGGNVAPPPTVNPIETVETLAQETIPANTAGDNDSQTAAAASAQEKEGPPPGAPHAFYRLEVSDKVAITFDDGPCPEMTEQYLEVLQTYGIQSTFFVIGRQVNLYPEATKKITAQGSEIGSHSWQHAVLDQWQPEQITADLEKTADLVYTLLEQKIFFFRPPYGRGSADVLEAAKGLGQRLVYWDVDPRDWKNPLPEEIVKRIMEQVKPGSIIILHEGRQNTLAALPGIIEGLRARGLEPVSISALLSAATTAAATAATTEDLE